MKKLIVICLVLSSIVSYGQEITTLSLTGVAHKKVQPDRFNVNVDLKAEGKSQKESFNSLNILFAKVLNELKSLNFSQDEIKMNDYSFYTRNVASEKSKQDIRCYATQSLILDFKLDKDRIFKIYAILLNSAKDGISLNFTTSISDSLMNKTNNELAVSALLDAQKKAELISATSKLKIMSVKNITYHSSGDYNDEAAVVKFVPPILKADEEESNSETDNYFSIADVILTDQVKVTYYLEK